MIYAAYNHMEQDNDTVLNGLLTGTMPAADFSIVNDPEQDVFAIGMKHKF